MEHKNVLMLFAIVALGAAGLYYWSKTDDTSPLAELVQTPTVVEEKKDGSPAAPAAPSAPAPTAERVIENGAVVNLVYLTSLGFTPYELRVNSGEIVRFVNKTDGAMRIGTNAAASSHYYSGVAQPDVVGSGGTYEAGLVTVGVWSYENSVNPRAKGATGVIYVR